MAAKTLTEIAALCGADLEGDGDFVVVGPASLEEAEANEISFLGDPRYRKQLDRTRAGAVLVPSRLDLSGHREGLALLRVANPNVAFTQVVRSFTDEPAPIPRGIHPTAVVDPSARIGEDVAVGPFCVIGPRAEVSAHVVLHSHCTLGESSFVGERTVLHPFVSVYARVRIGADCLIHSGAVLGADGYGFEPREQGWEKIPQCGTVEIADEVEIGANTTIDRGRFGATRIGRGAKLDNLVHVAHNVVVEERALLCAQVGIAGSARVGSGAILAGQVGVGGHLEVGRGARVGGQAGVFGNIPAGQDYAGWPARPRQETLKRIAMQKRLPELLERLTELEQRVSRLQDEARASEPGERERSDGA